jgi:hypothetical protein
MKEKEEHRELRNLKQKKERNKMSFLINNKLYLNVLNTFFYSFLILQLITLI